MKINIRLKQLSLQSTLVKPPQIYDSSVGASEVIPNLYR